MLTLYGLVTHNQCLCRTWRTRRWREWTTFLLSCVLGDVQPVYVRDVVEALLETLKNPDSIGKTYSLAGPRIFTCALLAARPMLYLCLPAPQFDLRRSELRPMPAAAARQGDMTKRCRCQTANCICTLSLLGPMGHAGPEAEKEPPLKTTPPGSSHT